MSELHDTLRRATDHLEAGHLDRIDHASGLAGRAWAEGVRRRSRRRAAAVAAGVACLVLVVGVPLVLGDGAPDAGPPADGPTTRTPDPDGTGIPGSPEATQPLWDPFSIPDLPQRESVLPARLAPVDDAPSVEEEPLDAAVLAWTRPGVDLHLLGTGGDWRSVPGTAPAAGASYRPVVGAPSLTPDGTRVAISTEPGLVVVDVTTGERQVLPWPQEMAPPWDSGPGVQWLPGGQALLAEDWNQRWIIGLDGSAEPAPHAKPQRSTVAVDPMEEVYEIGGFPGVREVSVRDGGRRRHVADFPWWSNNIIAGQGMLAWSGGSDQDAYGRGGPMVLDLESGELVGYAPIKDRNTVYTDNGYLRAVGFMDRETLLMQVAPMDFKSMRPGDEEHHLVAWHWPTGEFERLTSSRHDLWGVSVASGVVDP